MRYQDCGCRIHGFFFLALAGQGHALSSRVRDRAVLGTKLILRVYECFRVGFFFLFALWGLFVVKRQCYKRESAVIRNNFP